MVEELRVSCCNKSWGINMGLVEDSREDAYSRTGGIFIRDTARDTAWDTAYSLWFNEIWPYASLNHNEYAVYRAVSRMKMPPVREYASSLMSHTVIFIFMHYYQPTKGNIVWLRSPYDRNAKMCDQCRNRSKIDFDEDMLPASAALYKRHIEKWKPHWVRYL